MTIDNTVPNAELIERGRANLRERRVWMPAKDRGLYPIADLVPVKQAVALEELKATLS